MYDVNLIVTRIFVDVFQRFSKCSGAAQSVIRDMIRIIHSDDVTADECEAALTTVAEALFAKDCDCADPEARRILKRMKREEAAFSKRLAALLEAKGMTQDELAEAIGVDQSAISMMLNRSCRPQRQTVKKIAYVLKVSTEDVWPGFSKLCD